MINAITCYILWIMCKFIGLPFTVHVLKTDNAVLVDDMCLMMIPWEIVEIWLLCKETTLLLDCFLHRADYSFQTFLLHFHMKLKRCWITIPSSVGTLIFARWVTALERITMISYLPVFYIKPILFRYLRAPQRKISNANFNLTLITTKLSIKPSSSQPETINASFN